MPMSRWGRWATLFHHLNWLLHIFFGVCLTWEREHVSMTKKLFHQNTPAAAQPWFALLSCFSPAGLCFWNGSITNDSLGFGGLFYWPSFCPLSPELIRLKIGEITYCHSRNLCCVMWIPGFSLRMQKTWHILRKMFVFTSKVLKSEGEHGWGAASDCIFNFLPEKSCFCIWSKW